MIASKNSSSIVLVQAAMLILASSASHLFAGNHPAVAKWDLQVDTVEAGDVNIGPDFVYPAGRSKFAASSSNGQGSLTLAGFPMDY